MTNPDAVKFDRITYDEVLARKLHVMDSTATAHCMDNNMPIIVFSLNEEGNMYRALKGEPVGTIVE